MTRHSPRLRLVEDGQDGRPAPPAFVIDAAAGAIVAANASGRRAWGLDPADGNAVLAIDRAMPVLQQLWPLSRSRASAMLTFWAATGLLTLYCRVEPAGRGAGVYLVRALRAAAPAHAADGGVRPVPPGPPAGDAAEMPA